MLREGVFVWQLLTFLCGGWCTCVRLVCECYCIPNVMVRDNKQFTAPTGCLPHIISREVIVSMYEYVYLCVCVYVCKCTLEYVYVWLVSKLVREQGVYQRLSHIFYIYFHSFTFMNGCANKHVAQWSSFRKCQIFKICCYGEKCY